MTFDARSDNSSSRNANFVFGAIAMLVTASAFFAVLNLPQQDAPVHRPAANSDIPSHPAVGGA
ncbi:MAG: hypothetical protein GYB49_15060 [Alphaproteobacteria bacterium]|nr:hypothetical protein [Alphaproteobacteria bacterium]